MIKKAVILCGGLATRFLPISKSVPKEILPILNRPALDYCIQDLKENGITDILIIIGRNKECLENYYDRNIELEERLKASNKTAELESLEKIYSDVNITFMRQIYAKGTGYAVNMAKDFAKNEPFILIFPDEILLQKSFAKQLIEAYKVSNTSILPLREIPIQDSYKYGMIQYEKSNKGIRVLNLIEKPSPEKSPGNICYTGGGLFTPDIFDNLDTCTMHDNGEIYLTDAFYDLIKKDNLYGVITDGIRVDLGSPLGFVKGNVLAGLNDEKMKDELKEFLKDIVNNF